MEGVGELPSPLTMTIAQLSSGYSTRRDRPTDDPAQTAEPERSQECGPRDFLVRSLLPLGVLAVIGSTLLVGPIALPLVAWVSWRLLTRAS